MRSPARRLRAHRARHRARQRRCRGRGLRPTLRDECTSIEIFRKLIDEGRAGDNAGLLLRGVKREDVERGQCWRASGSITPHTHFECEMYVLTKEEGGRHTPFLNGYQPQFFFRTTDVTGVLELPDSVDKVMPGDTAVVSVELNSPIAMELGQRFAVSEGGKTVGAGVVLRIHHSDSGRTRRPSPAFTWRRGSHGHAHSPCALQRVA